LNDVVTQLVSGAGHQLVDVHEVIKAMLPLLVKVHPLVNGGVSMKVNQQQTWAYRYKMENQSL
jgi:hypothetical protein